MVNKPLKLNFRWLIIFFTFFLFIVPKAFSDENIVDKGPFGDFRIYNKGYLVVLEYSCIKHVKKGDLKRAREVFEMANWQCSEKEYLSVQGEDAVKEFNDYLEEAKRAKIEHKKKNSQPWICYPSFEQIGGFKKDFYNSIGKEVYELLRKKQVREELISVVISQIAFEIDWGRKIKGNNLFNIKGKYKGESIRFKTHEQLNNGRWVEMVAEFRKYPNTKESLEDYLNVVQRRWSEAYKVLFSAHGGIHAFLKALGAGTAGGYATNKSYAQEIDLMSQQISLAMELPALPVYLKCVGREEELNKFIKRREACLQQNRSGFCL